MKRFIVLFLVLTLAVSLFACNKGEETTTETETEPYTMKDVSDVPSPVKINGVEVPYAVFRYYYAAVRYRYDKDDPAYWENNDYTETIREEVIRYIRRNYAVEELAKQYNVELTPVEINKIKQQLYSERMAGYEDDNEYFKTLDEYFLTEEVNQKLEELASLEEKLFNYLTSEESGPKITAEAELIKRYLDNYVIRADHILILNDEGDDKNENETLINELYEKLLNGADFEELKEKYSEDDETNGSAVGYYMAKDDISKILSDAAFSLNEGEISEVIYAPYGYHIVKRLSKDEDYIKDNLSGTFASFYQSHIFEEMLNKLTEKQNIEYDQSFYTYTPTTIK